MAVAGGMEKSMTLETASPDRVANMYAFSEAALKLLIECLENAPPVK